MSTASRPQTLPPAPTPEDDEFPLGWRYRTILDADGRPDLEQLALIAEDLLYPEEGDCAMYTQGHQLDRDDLQDVFRARLAGDASALVLRDVRVDWQAGLRPNGPDVDVFLGVEGRKNWSTYPAADEGAERALVVEVVSPRDGEVRDNDVVKKVGIYHRAGIRTYLVVDDLGRGGPRQLRLVGYRWEPSGYEPMVPDDRGRLWLEAVRVWLRVDGDRVACDDPETGRRFGDYAEVDQVRIATEAAATADRARAVQAEGRAQADARARADLEAQVAAMRAEIDRLKGTP